jgi:hypothetical protein
VSASLQDLTDSFFDEIPAELRSVVVPGELARWLNEGRTRLGYYLQKETDLTWVSADRTVALPTDYFRFTELTPDVGTVLPKMRIHGPTIYFIHSDGAASDGTARLLYLARVPVISDSQVSLLTEEGEQAIISFARYRFYSKIAASRSDYRRYSTLLGANAVAMEELDALAAGYLADFQSGQETLPTEEPVTFYGD